MRRKSRLLLLVAAGTVALLVTVAGAWAGHANRPHSANMKALGHSAHPTSFNGTVSAQRNVSSDIAFWGDLAFNGNYDGFRIIRASAEDPEELNWTHCNGDQGDIVVWGNILVRAWNSPAPADNPTTPIQENRFCDGQPVPVGFEGMHIFDISDISDPKLVGEVELSARPEADSPGCGTHTLTLAPDPANNRAIIYNATSGGNAALPPGQQECDWIDIVQVPLNNPGAASHVRREPLEGGHAAHDNGVILGDVNKLAVASGHMSNVFDIGNEGGTLTDPKHLYTIEEPGVCNTGGPLCNGNWHSAAFTWDGQVVILGWEPGGGAAPECESTDPAVKKSAFFYDADTGEKLGQWTLPRPQDGTPPENCTIHNYNVVPKRSGKYALVVGNYQAGTWVVDFSKPAKPKTVAWSDPPPLPQVTSPTTGMPVNELGGAWSSYFYNGNIWESEITKGLNVFRNGWAAASSIRLSHLNPQTQEFSLP